MAGVAVEEAELVILEVVEDLQLVTPAAMALAAVVDRVI